MTDLRKLKYPAIFLILAGVVFLCFGNALFNKFVWDDGYLITENPYIKSFKFFSNLFVGDITATISIKHQESWYYRPLSMFSFMLDYRVWRLNPFGFHLTNIILHILNSVLVFLFIERVSRNRIVSLLAGILFAVHPIHVEAVTPVYNRMGIQSAFFMLSALLLFWESRNLEETRFLAGSLFLFLLGLLSKEDVIVLPLLFLCYDFFYFSDLKFKELFLKRKVIFYLSCFTLGVLYILLRKINIHQSIPFPVFHPGGSQDQHLAANAFFHILTVIKILNEYIYKMIFPFVLLPIYHIDPVTRLTDVNLWASLLVVTVSLASIFILKRKHKEAGFFIAFFFVSILPFANIIPIGSVYTFQERFLYLPSVSACYLASWGMGWLLGRFHSFKNARVAVYMAPIALIVSLGFFTAISNYSWRNDLTLWQDTVKKLPINCLAHANLSYAYMEAGREQEAVAEINKSMALSPTTPDQGIVYILKLSLAKIATENGRYEEAVSEINEALSIAAKVKLNPFAAYDKLGFLYVRLKDKAKAEESFKQSLFYNASFVGARYNLGVLYYEDGKYQEAQKQFEEAIRFDPDFSYAALALGLTYRAQNKTEEAMEMFKTALKIDPNFQLAKQYLDSLHKGNEK